MQVVNFDSGLADRIEQSIIKDTASVNSREPLLLDLTGIQFIHIDALVYLISFITKRQIDGVKTKIRYYSNEGIRKILHNFRFFETIEDVANINIRDIAEDLPPHFEKTFLALDYFKKPKYEVSDDGSSRVLTDVERLEHLQNIGFYPLTSLPFSNNSEKSYTLKEEPKKWTEGKPIVSIIQRNLPDKTIIGDKISKNIIYESITNSIRHPESHKLVISCIKQENYYTLVIWDDGKSIIDTLLEELKKGNSIKADASDDDIHSCYCVRKGDKKPGIPKADDFQYFFSFDSPDLHEQSGNLKYKQENWFILLSSLFPGITRDPKGIDYQKNEIFNQEEKPSITGRGLTYLTNTAVRVLGGEVRIRTNNCFLNIKRADKDYKTLPDIFFKKFKDEYYIIDYKEKYDLNNITPQNKKIINSLFRAKCIEFPKEHKSFYGNMITIQIPQK